MGERMGRQKQARSLRHGVFWPPFLLVTLALGLSFYDSPGFVAVLNRFNTSALAILAPWFAWTGLLALVLCAVVAVSPMGSVHIGGKGARRLLQPASWCSVTLCTSTAVGILFWAMAEPVMHYGAPPAALGIRAGTPAAADFALSTLFLHWCFTPAALYTLPSVAFAFAFYNMKQPFSLSAPLVPLVGERGAARLSGGIDAISLYALVAGMAASLATGVLTIAGGIAHQWGIASAPASWIALGILVVGAFVTSAAVGLDRGVKTLSNINTVFFIALAVYVLWYGPTLSTFFLGLSGVQEYAATFVEKSLFLKFEASDAWPKMWTVFYWSVWIAWAPVTAAFLGRIGVGYTVRTFVLVNVGVPAVFSLLWMWIFGGTAIALEQQGVGLGEMMRTQGAESAVYNVLGQFPFARLMIPFFLISAFLGYVTAADSNTMAMAGMSSHGMSADSPEPKLWIKLTWGCMVGLLALVMLCACGVDGIKTLSYLGGIPALLYEIAMGVSVLWVCFQPARFDKMSEPETVQDRKSDSLVPAPAV